MELSSAVITLTLAHPGIQQLEDGFFDSLWGVGAWEILAKLLAGQGNVIPFRLFLLHALNKFQHGRVVPDTEGIVRMRMELIYGDAVDAAYRFRGFARDNMRLLS